MSAVIRRFVWCALLATTLGACEASTSGGDQVAVIDRGGSAAVPGTAGSASASGGSASGTGGAPELPECLTCALDECLEPLSLCGTDRCEPLITCLAACSNGECREKCLDASDEPLVVAASSCLRASCADACEVSGGAAIAPSAVLAQAEAECKVLQACAPPILKLSYGDLAGCIERLSILPNWRFTLPDTGVTEDGLAACGEEISTLDCAQFYSVRVSRGSCIMPGTRALGDACIDAVQCASGFCPAARFGCATCAPMPHEGDVCHAPEECPAGLYCTATSLAAGACVVPAAVGDACKAGRPCDQFLACVSGLCAPVAATKGAACGSTTASPSCDYRKGLTCSSATTGTCITFVPVALGASCGLVNGEFRVCERTGQCLNGTCSAKADAGEKCAATGPFCQIPEACIDGICVGVPENMDCFLTEGGQ